MVELKPIARESVSRALERAARYRLLNEPQAAESICLDILDVVPEHQEAHIALLLSLTDQFDYRLGEASSQAHEVLAHLLDSYAQAYYEGIIHERWAKAVLKRGGPHSGHMAYDQLMQALACYEKAEEIRPPDNDEAILRWNTCVRILKRRSDLVPRPDDEVEPMLE